MNTLKLYPKKIRKQYIKNIRNSGISPAPDKYNNKVLMISLITSLIFSSLFYFLEVNMFYSLAIFVFLIIFFYFRVSLKASARIKKMENVFPDVISLMASNLRAGITIDKAFLLSARPEFSPLDEEILKTGKEVATGQEIVFSLKEMSERIDSEKISKVVTLIISGLSAGGNISDLLEETARNMKEKEIIEKKAISTILMYVIFIFIAVGVGAPVLFGLSTVLVEIVINLAAKMPDMASSSMSLPFTFSEIPISVNFIIYFSLAFIVVTDLISCFVIGLVNKGEGKAGLRFFIPLVIASIGIFFIVRIILAKVMIDAISGF